MTTVLLSNLICTWSVRKSATITKSLLHLDFNLFANKIKNLIYVKVGPLDPMGTTSSRLQRPRHGSSPVLWPELPQVPVETAHPIKRVLAVHMAIDQNGELEWRIDQPCWRSCLPMCRVLFNVQYRCKSLCQRTADRSRATVCRAWRRARKPHVVAWRRQAPACSRAPTCRAWRRARKPRATACSRVAAANRRSDSTYAASRSRS
jgi:hypothetical protein